MLSFNRAVGAINKYLRARGSASRKRIVEHFSESWSVHHNVVNMFLVMAINGGYVIRDMNGRYMSSDMNAPTLNHVIKGRTPRI